jgi:ligand-binding SRPBCC domain-containing protein
MSFQILTPRPIEMRAGTIIDYKVGVRGLPLRWRSEITVWDPPHRFVDEQLRGPYRYWHHDHEFESRDGGTLCRDHVAYAVPFDILAHRFFVRRELETIFDFRRQAMEQRFAAPAS